MVEYGMCGLAGILELIVCDTLNLFVRINK